jgi:hypothetical protein
VTVVSFRYRQNTQGGIMTTTAKLVITGAVIVLVAVLIAFGSIVHGTANRVSALQQQANRAARVIGAQANHIQRLDAALTAQQKDMTQTQADLAAIGRPTQTGHLGLCVNYDDQGTDSNNDTYTYEDVEQASLANGVVSCSTGSFVSVVPGSGGNGGN